MLQDLVKLNAVIAHILQISSGFFWTLTYLLIIRRSFKDKTYGMPMVAICANVAWEFIFSFVHPHPLPQLYIDYLWLFLDLGILVQYLRYGKKEFTRQLNASLFLLTFLFTLLFSALLILLISQEFNEYIGIYAAFGQNLVMSVLFIHLFLKREDAAGQSLYIALCKMIGTIFPSILFYLYFPHSYLLLLLYAGIFIFDLAYFLLLYFRLQTLSLHPWRRI